MIFYSSNYLTILKIYVDKFDHPFSTQSAPFNWIRARLVGGRGHVWGRVCPRYTDDEFSASDMNSDGMVDVLDIVMLVNAILGD